MAEQSFSRNQLKVQTGVVDYIIDYLNNCNPNSFPVIRKSRGKGFPKWYDPRFIQTLIDHLTEGKIHADLSKRLDDELDKILISGVLLRLDGLDEDDTLTVSLGCKVKNGHLIGFLFDYHNEEITPGTEKKLLSNKKC